MRALASRNSTAEQLPCGGSPLTVTRLRRVRFQVPMVADLGRVMGRRWQRNWPCALVTRNRHVATVVCMAEGGNYIPQFDM